MLTHVNHPRNIVIQMIMDIGLHIIAHRREKNEQISKRLLGKELPTLSHR